MTISMDRPTLSMYQFGKSWSSKTYQFGGTVVIQLVFGDFDSKQVHFKLSNDECEIGLACRGLE